ncbi:MAG: LLM class flavin-dependent oxidoreductase [Actinomycetota bacterium]
MGDITLSCAFATSIDTPAHIRVAEQLGYERAWTYDSPALYPDVWGILYLAAERTETIGLGPAVLIPSLRHPMANAAAIAGLVALAPGRVAVALGSGFTGRYTLGHRPLRWAFVEEYVRALQGLLAGETVEWEGRPIRMMHPDGFGAARPIDVPILLGADGPKGIAVAQAIGDGVFSAGAPSSSGMEWQALLQFGTVLDDDEPAESQRVLAAAGHGVAVLYHAVYERAGAAVDDFPGGAVWREAVEQIPEAERHLATHDGHLVHLTDRDRAALAAGGSALLPTLGLTGTAAQVRERVDQLAAAGVTEIAYQPAGPDIPGELERLAAALH